MCFSFSQSGRNDGLLQNTWSHVKVYLPRYREWVNLPHSPLLPLKMRQKQAQRVRSAHSYKTYKIKSEIITESSQVTFIYIALLTIQIVSKQLHQNGKIVSIM